MAEQVAERVAKAMERMDSDGDGLITSSDRGYSRLSSRTGLEGDITQAQLEEAMLVQAAERQSEKEMEWPTTREEMEAKVTADFTALDTDGDGVLSREERPERGGRDGSKRHKGGDDHDQM